jgi:hypothetical protein
MALSHSEPRELMEKDPRRKNEETHLVGNGIYRGKRPEYKQVRDPLTGVVHTTKVARGVPFLKVTNIRLERVAPIVTSPPKERLALRGGQKKADGTRYNP